MLRGHVAAAEMQKRLLAAEGPREETSFEDAIALITVVDELHGWPGQRSRLGERGVEEVRRRWAKIQRHYRAKARADRRTPNRDDARKARSRAR